MSSGAQRLFGVRPRAEQAALLGVPRREQDAALRPLALFRRERVGLGDLEQRDDARSVVVGAVEDLRRVRAVVIEVRRDDHPFVLQPRIAAFEQRDDVAIGHDVAIDRGAQLDARRPAAATGVKPRAVSADRDSSSNVLPGAGDERRRQRRRNLRHRNANAIGPRRRACSSECAAASPASSCAPSASKFAGARMVVHVADEQHRRPRPCSCAASALRHGVDGSDVTTPSNGLFAIALARLVIEREDDLAFHVAVVVVVLQVRRADAEADERRPAR